MMRRSLRRELNKLRELSHFLLHGLTCCFCGKLLSERSVEWTAHGNSTGPAFEDSITIHHINGDHEDNRHENKALCHTKCHKSHHRREANLARSKKTVDLKS